MKRAINTCQVVQLLIGTSQRMDITQARSFELIHNITAHDVDAALIQGIKVAVIFACKSR